jgi:VIT1/CCC1 family predicted Fe2+/Mn2+ transporter
MSSNGSAGGSTTGILSNGSSKMDYGTSSYSQVMVDVKNAFGRGDAEQSRLLHQLKMEMGSHTHAQENHMTGGEHIKSAVYGGLDGIITTFATVTSVAGSGLPHSVILIIGLAHLVADGLSMGLGDMLSSQAEADLSNHERSRELWEFENYPEGEIEEMVELYEKKGISTDDALLVVHTLAKYKDAFIDIMMIEELNLMPVDDDDSPLTGGIITFVSFMLFGVIPLLSYLVNLIPGVGMSPETTLYMSCFLTVVTLFLLGAVKGKFVGQKMWRAGGSMAINGTIAAACGWVIGYLLQLTGIQNV